MTQKLSMFINGEAVKPSAGQYFETHNPADNSVLAEVPRANVEDVNRAVAAAASTAEGWAETSPMERGRILKRLAVIIADNADRLGQMESDDMGMPTQSSPGIIQATAEFFEYFGGIAPTLQGETLPVDKEKFIYTLYEPFGVVGVITPWNAPLNQAARSVAPALAAGNTVVLKPSEWASMTTLELGAMANEAGLPPGVLNIITGFGDEAGAPLAAHPLVGKVAFTGSVATGQAIARIAADKVMPVTLELGGKSPNIVFDDADLEAAVPQVLFGFIANSGQVCTSGSRVLVQRSIYQKFSQLIADAAQQIPIGRDRDFPTLGPIANKMQFDKVMGYFDSAKQEGATILTGGERATGDGLNEGLYVKPTIFTDVTMDMKIVREEIFGPAGVLIPFDTEEEAVQLANDTEYGLGSGLWTQNLSRAHRVAAKIKAGIVWVNTYHVYMVGVPEGGYKKSGIGRERGVQALKQYSQLKTVTIQLTP